ncbi:hypothetical protein IE81DRAFT_352505 [Ceraceosorus guamensis]|uniref:Large ribosomal subunit protein uL5 C-terminal domain-containing protein n=1 Tax=Ceraceosorus guamensis TaxID=1522189 RepID=A0A316W9K3_9BASI|nr:hypothetical protein IE81DRAFT_352505 [Ceraceosorus guamensis]PWN44355.1 hypothetical protein IE81DRAFT_352505 [Ceraceosorus guamensis]
MASVTSSSLTHGFARSARASATKSTSSESSLRAAIPSASAAAPSAAPSSSSSTTRLAHTPVEIGPTQLNRLSEHYNRTLSPLLLYMTYDPQNLTPSSDEALRAKDLEHGGVTSTASRGWDPASPYTQHRPQRPPRGNRRLAPAQKPPSAYDASEDLPRIERLHFSVFVKDAVSNKQLLVPVIAQLRAITGARVLGSLADKGINLEHPGGKGYIRVVKSSTRAASFRVRPGMPVGVTAVLPAPVALEVIDQLSTFVLPRVRTFSGYALPPASAPARSPAAQSGVVSLGLTPEAMRLWPGTEVNWDAYSGKGLGAQIDIVTNLRGPHATEKARLLLSGLGIPFLRRGDIRT